MTYTVSSLELRNIRFFTAVASLLLSLQAIYFDDIINRDGVLYLQIVQAYLSGGLEATKLIFDWPFFSILVAWFHQFTSINIELSALLVNSLFFILLTDTLIRINALVLNNKSQLIISAVLILCFSSINEYRDFIMRDFGYWALCSLSLYHYLQFDRNQVTIDALLWQIYIVLATLFRIEGLIILLALPFFCFYDRDVRTGLHNFILSVSIIVLALIFSALIFFMHFDITSAFGKVNTLSSYLNFNNYFLNISNSASFLADNILNKYSDEYASLILISGLFSMMLYKLAKTFSLSYLIIYAFSARIKLDSFSQAQTRHQKLLLFFITINLLILTVFLLHQYFLSSRYLGMTLIGILLFCSFRMSSGIEQIWRKKQYFVLSVMALALAYSVIDIAVMSTTKTYIKQTALWAAHNLPNNSKVMTDDEFIMYYFERDNETSTLCVRPISNEIELIPSYNSQFVYKPCDASKINNLNYFDYLVLVEKRRYPEYLAYIEKLDLELIYQSSSRKGDRASVYRVLQ